MHSSLRHARTSAAASATRSASTRSSCLLPPRAQAQPPGAVDGVADRPAHGERARERAQVPRRRGPGQGRRDDARLQGPARSTTAAPSRATSRSAASSGRRSRRAATAGGTSASTSRRCARTSRRSAPNRGYSRMQHLWLTERIIDIVAHELGLDPVEMRKRNYVRPTSCRTRRRTAASTTPATTRAASTSRSS